VTPATPPTAATTAPPEAPGGAGAAALTLAPLTVEEFLERHWDQRPALLARDEAGRFDGLLSTAEAERLVGSTAIRTPAFRLVRDGVQLPLSSYTQDIPWRPGSFTGTVVVDRVAEEFAAGATIVLQALHFSHLPVAEHCRGLELALGCPVQCNAYWTPAAAQGFAVHHDTHDVFVLQVSGRKRWRVYDPVLELPLRDQKWSPELGDPGAPVMEFDLAPGDTLYLPRGWPHEAETSETDSLHLTIGLHPPTRLDALRAALSACADDVEFRRALDPSGELPLELLDRLAERLRPADVAGRARRSFVEGRRPIRPDALTQRARLASLGAQTLVRRRPTVIADLRGGTLHFEGRRVSFPPQALAALHALHGARGPLCADDLPGPLDAPGRLVLLRRLVREGYLELA
jgi:ribosomal protein L16 Arg81 hydroxylase